MKMLLALLAAQATLLLVLLRLRLSCHPVNAFINAAANDNLFMPVRSIVQRTKSCGIHAPAFAQRQFWHHGDARRLSVVGLQRAASVGFGGSDDGNGDCGDSEYDDGDVMNPASFAA